MAPDDKGPKPLTLGKLDNIANPEAMQASARPKPLIILVLADNFRRQDHSGWAKAAWTLFVIFVPLIGVLVYMIARPKDDLMEA